MKIIPNKWRPIHYCKEYIRKVSTYRVLSGPFTGMNYTRESIGSELFPKILGTYEKELHTEIEQIEGETLVVGAGEGYYAVGLARKLKTPITCFEADAKGRNLIVELARLNNVENLIEINGKCHPEDLINVKPGMKYGIMDIEGMEISFLNEGIFEMQKGTKWLVEIHSRESRRLFNEKLKSFYDINFIKTHRRSMADYPIKLPWFLKTILGRYWKSLVQEWRTDSIGWLVLIPKTS